MTDGVLLDTGILLRFVNKSDREHPIIQSAVGALIDRGQPLFVATQNIAEFCNVATRPLANNGLALLPNAVIESIQLDIS